MGTIATSTTRPGLLKRFSGVAVGTLLLIAPAGIPAAAGGEQQAERSTPRGRGLASHIRFLPFECEDPGTNPNQKGFLGRKPREVKLGGAFRQNLPKRARKCYL